jgi:hypothetical protein
MVGLSSSSTRATWAKTPWSQSWVARVWADWRAGDRPGRRGCRLVRHGDGGGDKPGGVGGGRRAGGARPVAGGGRRWRGRISCWATTSGSSSTASRCSLAGFDLAAAEGVCSGAPLDSLDIVDLLTSLVDKSLASPRDVSPVSAIQSAPKASEAAALATSAGLPEDRLVTNARPRRIAGSGARVRAVRCFSEFADCPSFWRGVRCASSRRPDRPIGVDV